MENNVKFSSGGTSYMATSNDIFMDNGAKVMFIKNGKHSHPTMRNIELPYKEWQRIKQHLSPIDYEIYYGHKPLMSGVSIYQVKQQ